MITLTKEWLLKTIAELEEERDAVPGAVNEDVTMALAAMKLALASLEAEAVAFRSKLKPPSAIGSENWGYTDHRLPDAFELESCVIERLYTAPPAPVAVPEMKPVDLDEGFEEWYSEGESGADSVAPEWFSEAMKPVFLGTWRACRAAMLQGAEPVTAAYKLPSREHFILLCNQFWNWQEADEINAGEEEPRLEWNGSEFTNRVTQALWRMYQASPGNSPAIPDGWVVVPVEPTEEMNKAGWTAMNEHDAINPTYRAMLAAAPQQEA